MEVSGSGISLKPSLSRRIELMVLCLKYRFFDDNVVESNFNEIFSGTGLLFLIQIFMFA